MSTWMKLLPMELEDIKDFADTGKETHPEDKVIGTLTDEHRQLFTLWHRLKRAADLEEVELKYEASAETRAERQGKCFELFQKATCLENLFWIAVNEDFKLWPTQFLAIRKGWVLVQRPAPKGGPHQFFQIMGGNPPETE